MRNIFEVILHLTAGTAASILSYPLRTGTAEKRFINTFLREKLFIINSEIRNLLNHSSKCLSCSICERVIPLKRESSNLCFLNMPDFLNNLRMISDINFLQEKIIELQKIDLESMELLCPASIPFRAMLNLIQNLLDQFKNQ